MPKSTWPQRDLNTKTRTGQILSLDIHSNTTKLRARPCDPTPDSDTTSNKFQHHGPDSPATSRKRRLRPIRRAQDGQAPEHCAKEREEGEASDQSLLGLHAHLRRLRRCPLRTCTNDRRRRFVVLLGQELPTSRFKTSEEETFCEISLCI